MIFALNDEASQDNDTLKSMKTLIPSTMDKLHELSEKKGGLIGSSTGFKDLDKHSTFLDNAMRGERGGHPMLMKYAAIALMKWLFNVMCVDEIYGYTFANNAMGLRLNKELGFDFVDIVNIIA